MRFARARRELHDPLYQGGLHTSEVLGTYFCDWLFSEVLWYTYRLGYSAWVGIPDFSFLTRQMYELTNVKWQTLRKNVIASRLAGKYCKRNKQLLWVISYRQSNSHSSLLTQSTVPALLLFSVVNCKLMLTKITTIYSEPKDIFHPPTRWWQQK